MVMILLVVASTLSWQYMRNSQEMLREVESKADEYVTRLSDILSVPIWNFDTRTIDQIGTVFAQYDLVNEVRILDPLGKVLFTTLKKEDPDARIFRERDIMYEGEIIGHATVVLSLAAYKKDLSRLVTTNLFALGGVLTVILVATGLLLRIYLRRPLEVLLEGMNQVARGDFNFDFSVIQNVELGFIADNFASMTKEIAAREKQLVEINRQLEGQIRERERAEAALRLSEERYSLVVTATNDGIWDWDLTTDEVYFSPRWKAIIGYQDSEIPNDLAEWQGRMHPADLDRVLKVHEDYLSGVSDVFEVAEEKGYRVNIIGFTQSGVDNECGMPVHKEDILSAYSVDNAGEVYRVEVYRGNKFSGMVLVKFGSAPAAVAVGKESSEESVLGR